MKKIILLSFLTLSFVSPIQAENGIAAFFGAFFGALFGTSVSEQPSKPARRAVNTHVTYNVEDRRARCINGNDCGHEYERLVLLSCGKCTMHESCKNSRVHTALNAKKAPECGCREPFEYDMAEQRALANSFETYKSEQGRPRQGRPRYENGKPVVRDEVALPLGCSCGYHMPFSELQRRIKNAQSDARRNGYEAYITCPGCKELVPTSRFG